MVKIQSRLPDVYVNHNALENCSGAFEFEQNALQGSSFLK
jgi:hypothetical protein